MTHHNQTKELTTWFFIILHAGKVIPSRGFITQFLTLQHYQVNDREVVELEK
jgi:hypothetical protein